AEQISFAPDKRYRLLAYLAYSGDWVSRDRAAFLFWPDTDDHSAKQNLRGLLKRVRALTWLTGLEADAHRLRWQVETDVAAFKQAVEEARLDEAVSLYTGVLLEGIEGDEATEFSSWLAVEREHLHASWRDALLRSVRELEALGRHEEAARLLRRLLDEDALDEEALRAYMMAAAQAGQQEKALQSYYDFARRLKDELDLEPTVITRQFKEAIQRADIASFKQASSAPVSTATVKPDPLPIPSLPSPRTSFVGRDLELAEIVHLLAKPDCRLLTLTGAGGIGKTRLALQAAQELTGRYRHGVYFVSLEALTSVDAIPWSIATALDLRAQGEQKPLALITQYLRDKQVLLVLDNYENLREGALLVSDLIEGCPGLDTLVTSREPLSLEEEWLLPLAGLAYPKEDLTVEKAYAYDALQLFVQRAQRVSPHFALTQEDLPAILKICRLVEGFPLGLELAAVWVRAMPVGQIAEEIEENLDFLTSSTRNVAERHKSIRAAFEHSWKLLTPKEQEILRKLSVFRGGFTREAAAVVAEAPIAVLAALLDKSLVRVSSSGRYDRHPLLYQYTQEKLAEHQEERAETQEKHGTTYLHFLREWGEHIHDLQFDALSMVQSANQEWGEHIHDLQFSPKQTQALRAIGGELENILTAWSWAIAEKRVEELREAMEPLRKFFRMQDRRDEGAEVFAQAVA
ncbi:MAG: AAA family ATPase, partial [Deinococcota bacterium]|nr:AAA family ATPase [Deinococcota bacterium]